MILIRSPQNPAGFFMLSTSFSIKKSGEKKAFMLAVDFRRARMREIFGKGFYRKLAVERCRREA